MQSPQKFEGRALANHLSYLGYGIAERLLIVASPGGAQQNPRCGQRAGWSIEWLGCLGKLPEAELRSATRSSATAGGGGAVDEFDSPHSVENGNSAACARPCTPVPVIQSSECATRTKLVFFSSYETTMLIGRSITLNLLFRYGQSHRNGVAVAAHATARIPLSVASASLHARSAFFLLGALALCLCRPFRITSRMQACTQHARTHARLRTDNQSAVF